MDRRKIDLWTSIACAVVGTTTALFANSAHAVGLVTDMGSILARGSIVARKYVLPAVLGVRSSTVRVRHGQSSPSTATPDR